MKNTDQWNLPVVDHHRTLAAEEEEEVSDDDDGVSRDMDIGNYTWKDRGVERHHSFLLP